MTGERSHELARNLTAVRARIARACVLAGRAVDDVTMIGITKTFPASDAVRLRELGVTDLGENRDQEAAAKAAEVSGVRWHFVGQMQRNKAAHVASYADVVHGVDRSVLVPALSRGAVAAGRSLTVLVQVSLDGDPARGGVEPGQVLALAHEVAGAQSLHFGGVMAVAPLGSDAAAAFAELAAVAAVVRAAYPAASMISAGMSGDLEAAVLAGATHVRVGSALLGTRASLLG